MARSLIVEEIALGQLRPYERNARTHSPAQVEQVAASVREFGWTNPLLIDEDGLIIAGHGRLAAAKLLGLAAVPCIRLLGLTDTQKRALAIADNKLALNAGWDEGLLAAELQSLGDLQGLVGFSEDELVRLFKGHAGLTDPDEAPEAPADPVSQRGDVWLLGAHRLLCGDATSAEDVALALKG
jgi:ParB-like chromosome segregation protein Spo0J